MLYYLGKGTEFKKEDCKEYKKLDAALRAAAKDESLVVWDETGKVIFYNDLFSYDLGNVPHHLFKL